MIESYYFLIFISFHVSTIIELYIINFNCLPRIHQKLTVLHNNQLAFIISCVYKLYINQLACPDFTKLSLP